MPDIIVCGGGPVGSQVAYELSKKGYSITVLEKRKTLGENVCCTGIVSLECVKSFEIPESLIIRRLNSAKIFSSEGNMLEVSSPEPVACVIDRGSFDAFMSERAVEAGVNYKLGTKVKSFEIRGNRLQVTIESNEQTAVLEAKAAVLATGAASELVRETGLQKKPDIVMGAQCEVTSPSLTDIEIYTGRLAPGFFAWLVPTLEGKALAGLLSRKNAAINLTKFLSFLSEKGKVRSTGKPCFRPITLRVPVRTYGERVLITGGAAGQVKPTTGGGIYYGLLSAGIAADVLHQALEKDDFSKESLSAYEKQWKAKLGGEMSIGWFLRGIYEHLTAQQIAFLINIVESSSGFRDFLGSKDIFFDWHGKSLTKLMKYRLKPLALSKT